MRKWKVVALFVAAGLLGRSAVLAQSGNDDLLRKEVEALKEENRRILKMFAEEREARERIERQVDAGFKVADDEIERYINDLSARFGGPTQVNSTANPITITGKFRMRSGWTFDRNFGLPANMGCTTMGATGSELGLLGPGCLNFLFFLQNPNPPQNPDGYGYEFPKGVTNVELTESLYEDLFTAGEDELFMVDLMALAAQGALTRGAFDDDDDEGSFVDARIRIGFHFALMEDVVTYWEVQSYGTFDNGVTPYPSFTAPFNDATDQFSEVDLYQGYIEFENVFGVDELSTRTGRMELTFGKEFQFGDNDFYAGESFDGWQGQYDSESWKLTGLMLRLSSDTFSNGTDHPFGFDYDDDELYSLYFTFKGIENVEIDLYWIYLNAHNHFIGSHGTDGGLRQGVLFQGLFNEAYYHTFGARVGGQFPEVASGLEWNVEAAFQVGDYSDPFHGYPVPDLSGDVAGWTLEAMVGITFGDETRFRVYARFLFADGPEDLNETGYLPLFPDRHDEYGRMDIVPMYNVLAGEVGIEVRPSQAWTIGFAGVYAIHDEDVFTIAESNGIVTIGRDDGIGWELNAFADYRYSDTTTLSLVLGVFIPDEGAPLAGWYPLERAIGAGEDDVAFLALLQARVEF